VEAIGDTLFQRKEKESFCHQYSSSPLDRYMEVHTYNNILLLTGGIRLLSPPPCIMGSYYTCTNAIMRRCVWPISLVCPPV